MLQTLSWVSPMALLRILLLLLIVLMVHKLAHAVQSLADSIALLAVAQQHGKV